MTSMLRILTLMLLFPVGSSIAEDAKTTDSTIERETRNLNGWTVHINKELLKSEPKATRLALGLLKKQLAEIVRVVPEPAVVELRKVPLYFSPQYPGKNGGAEFHPGAEWLKDNGRDPVMVKGTVGRERNESQAVTQKDQPHRVLNPAERRFPADRSPVSRYRRWSPSVRK